MNRRFPLLNALLWVALMAPATGVGQSPEQTRSNGGTTSSVSYEISAVPSTDIRLDGILDEPAWHSAPPATGFVQSEPDEGSPATERTEVWIAYDQENIYIGAHLYDSQPDAVVVKDIRKDFRIDNQDTFEVIFDTFADRRNGYLFATNAAGARADQQVTNEGRETNASWDAPWSVKTRRMADGWTVEMQIPFRVLRSTSTTGGRWGINFSRRIRRNNEVVFWAPVPRAYALTRVSLAGDLVGLPTSTGNRDLRITPYVLGETVRDIGEPSFDERVTAGGDLKYGLTRGLTLDLTVNPDFAQVEADEQQVNLTQFSQFYPEKRDFFLENSGIFYIGDTPRNTRLSTQPTGRENLIMFFSRRIGLGPDGRPTGINGGVRVTGKEGEFQVGALAMQTRSPDDSLIPGSDYGVFRLRRNVGANSDVGALVMGRIAVDDRDDYNVIYGADANIRLPERIDWSSFFVQSETDGVSGPRYAFQSTLNREANFVHIKFGTLWMADDFNNELGFHRRRGVRAWMIDTGIRPRLESLRRIGIREMHPHIVWNYYTDFDGFPGKEVAANLHSGYTFFLNNGGYVELSVNPKIETLYDPFLLSPGTTELPSGKYDWVEWMLRGTSDPSKVLSVYVTGILGGLWSGTQKTVNLTLSLQPTHHIRASIGGQRTVGDLGTYGDFVRQIYTARANYSFTTNMFVDALVQWDPETDAVNTNLRFNFIHHPLSNIYIVYNEQRFTTVGSPSPGRSLIFKVTQMLGI
ncbi:MAG: DUF5916 domain-containing protein [Gemmatimonadales bacterium]|jgi:hypothetical protein